jgi:hypothetical protein
MVEQCMLFFWDVYVRPHHVGWLNNAGFFFFYVYVRLHHVGWLNNVSYFFGMYMLGPIMLEHLQQMLHFNNLAKYEGFRPPADGLL